ncbi:MAG: hypothetical protein HDR03_14125 [Lachnospiraceae bacterium]|nr:hypothetical protein [Lachnospiraceae bacterium]
MNSKSVKEGGKHNMYSKSKRFIASFLAVLMAVCMLPAEMFGAVGVANAAVPEKPLAAPVLNPAGNEDGVYEFAADADSTSVKLGAYTEADAADVNIYWATSSEVSANPAEEAIIAANHSVAAASAEDQVIVTTVTDEITVYAVAVTSGTNDENEPVNAYSDITSVTYSVAEDPEEPEDPDAGKTDISTATVTLTATTVEAGKDVPTVDSVEGTTDGGETYSLEANEYDVAYSVGSTSYTAAELKELTISETTTVTVTVTAKGETYTGSAITTFTITPAGGPVTPPPSGEKNPVTLTLNLTDTKQFKNGVTKTYDDGYFSIKTVNTLETKDITVEDGNKIGLSAGTVKLQGHNIGTANLKNNTGRLVVFTPDSNGTVTVGAFNTNKDLTRAVGYQLVTEGRSDIDLDGQMALDVQNKLMEYSFSVEAGKTYAIGSAGTIDVCYVVVEEEDFTSIKTPEPNLAEGAVDMNAEITFAVPGIELYYSVSETEPAADAEFNISDMTKWDGTPFTIDKEKYITVIAKAGTKQTQPATYHYTVDLPRTGTPAVVYDDTAKTVTITNSSDDSDAEIYYTLDGKDPVNSTTEYTTAITLTETKTIRVVAKKDGKRPSETVLKTCIVKTTEETKYTMDPNAEDKFDSNSETDMEALGDDIWTLTNGRFKPMYQTKRAAILPMSDLITNLNSYTIEGLQSSWPTELGTLNENTKGFLINGGKADIGSGYMGNAIRVDVGGTKGTKVVVYYSGKQPTGGTAAKIAAFKATTENDTAKGDAVSIPTTDGNNPTTHNNQVGKAEFTLSDVGSYYIGFDGEGGVIYRIEVTENPDTTTPPADTVAAPTFYPTVAEGSDPFVYTFSTTEGTVAIEAEEGTVYYVLNTAGTNYATFEDDAETTVYTTNGTPYTGEIPVTDGMIIKAVAVKDGKASAVATSPEYKLGSIATLKGTVADTQTPAGDITEGDSDVKVTLNYTKGTGETDETAAAVDFLYTVDTKEDAVPEFSNLEDTTVALPDGVQKYDKDAGITLPTTKAGTVYVKVLAYTEAEGKVTALASTPASFEYTVKSIVTPPAMPTATVNGKAVANNGNATVTGSATVVLTSADNADIYYTDDNSEPDASSIKFEGSFSVTATRTIKAIAIKEGASSDVLTFTVTVNSDSYDDEGDEENEARENWYWDEDKYEIKQANGGKIPEGLWMAGIYEEGYSYNAGLKVTPDVDEEMGDHYGIRVYYHTHLLTYKTDYTVSYKNNVNAAKADAAKAPTVTISGKGSYTGKVTKTFTINPTKLSWIYDYECSSYVPAKKGNKAQQVVPTLTDEGYDYSKDKYVTKKLKNKKDFDVVYYETEKYNQVISENTGDKRKEELAKIALTSVTGPGDYKVVATGKDNYDGTKTFSVTVLESDAKLASKLKVTVDKVKYDQAAVDAAGFKGFEPKVTVKDGKKELTAYVKNADGTDNEADADYRISYENNTAAGTGYVTITPVIHTSSATGDDGKTTTTTTQAFYGTRYVNFKISGNPIKSAKVTYDGDLTYNNSSVIDKSKIKVTYKGSELKSYGYDSTAGKYVGDYSISVYNNYSAGKASVYIYGRGAYEGTLIKTFKIAPYDISKATVTLANTKAEEAETLKTVFSKGGCYPEVDVKCTFGEGDNARTAWLEPGEDYTISYKNNNNFKKTAEIIIKGKGDYKGTLKKTFAFEEKDLSTLTMSVPDVPLLSKPGKYGSKPVITDKSGVKVVNLAVKKDYTLEYFDVTPKSAETEKPEGSDPATQADEGTGEGATTPTTTEGTKIPDINKFTATKDTVIKVVATAVSGSGYKESISATYKVRENDFNKVTVKINPQVYAGKAVVFTPDKDGNISDITVTPKGGSALTLKTSKDSTEDGYYIDASSYVNNDKKGSAKVTLIGTGSYAGSKTVTFKITARKMEWAALTPSKVEETVESITNAIKGLFN